MSPGDERGGSSSIDMRSYALLVDQDIAMVVVGRALRWAEVDVGEVFTILQKCGSGDGALAHQTGPLGSPSIASTAA